VDSGQEGVRASCRRDSGGNIVSGAEMVEFGGNGKLSVDLGASGALAAEEENVGFAGVEMEGGGERAGRGKCAGSEAGLEHHGERRAIGMSWEA
jgi:hypothetical protein